MTERRPSELPVGTIIEFEDEWYVKVHSSLYGYYWQSLRCVDCRGGDYDTFDKQADTNFKEFKIISLPVSENIDGQVISSR